MSLSRNRLSEWRRRRLFTQDEVATLRGCDPTTISRHEAGKGLSKEDILEYATIYGATPVELFFTPDELDDSE